MEYMKIFLTSASVVRLFLAGQGELLGFLALGDFGIFFGRHIVGLITHLL